MYDRQHLYVTFGGEIGVPVVDYWQTGFRLADVTAGPDTVVMPTQAELEALADSVIATYFQNPDLGINAGARLNWVKVALIGQDGKYVPETQPLIAEVSGVEGGFDVNVAGGPQNAMVIGLRSGFSFGKANYGRLYLPWNSLTVEVSGKLSENSVANFSETATNFVNAINTWAGSLDNPLRLVIMSSIGAGTTKEVELVAVGNVVDVQRRRREAIEETYLLSGVA